MKPIYFISDAHLGAGTDARQREQALCQLLYEVKDDAGMVVFLGDIFDFWFTYRYVVPRGHVRLLGAMAALADAGVELHFFIGNHDMWLFDYLTSEMKIFMHSEPAVIEYDGHTFYCGHGDGLGHLDKRYDIIKWIFRNPLNQRLFACLPSGLTFGIAQGWSRSSRKGHIKKNPQLFEYWGDDKEGIVIHCKEQLQHHHYDFCVFGHRHTQVLRQLTLPDGRVSQYVNVGDWLSQRNYAVYHEGEIELRNY